MLLSCREPDSLAHKKRKGRKEKKAMEENSQREKYIRTVEIINK
jgi:hypothetical protein